MILNIILYSPGSDLKRYLRAYADMMNLLQNRTWVILSLFHHPDINCLSFTEHNLGVFECNYTWDYKQLSIKVAELVNHSNGRPIEEDRIRFFDKDGNIISYSRLVQDQTINEEPLDTLITNQNFLNFMALYPPSLVINHMDKSVLLRFKLFGEIDIRCLNPSELIIERKSTFKELLNCIKTKFDPPYQMALLVDRGTNVIKGFIQQQTLIEDIEGGKNELNIYNGPQTNIVRIQLFN